LKRLQRELDTTFFYVTNDQVEAMSMADRIAVLNEGVLQQVDTPETIYNHPANLFVAQFVGSPRINTMPCLYDSGRKQLTALDHSWALSLSDTQAKTFEKHSNQLIFGVRSEDIILYREPHPNAIAGKVYILEPLGDRTYVDIELGNHTIKARADADFVAKSGETIYLDFDTDRIHVFDADSEETIL
jgi:ABC-type sugar transport system ATPase subunit